MFGFRQFQRLILVVAFAVASFLANWKGQTRADDTAFRLSLNGKAIEGNPLWHNDQRVILLGRDGRLWDFKPEDAKDFAKSQTAFRSYSQGELRGQLLREFGRR